MNKSEIAEKAARDVLTNCALHFVKPETFSDKPQEVINQAISNGKRIVERAIAESQAPQPNRTCLNCGEDSWQHCRFHQPAHCKVECAQAHHDPILATEEYELGDGEPSPIPLAEAKELFELYLGVSKSSDVNTYVDWYKRVNDWLKRNSGAAQEVSPVGSVQKITGPERPRCPRCGAETTCLSCRQEVSPPSPEHCYCVCHSPTSSCPSCVHCCGDTRELKAALEHATCCADPDCIACLEYHNKFIKGKVNCSGE